jgi:hypothetical protein
VGTLSVTKIKTMINTLTWNICIFVTPQRRVVTPLPGVSDWLQKEEEEEEEGAYRLPSTECVLTAK